MNANKTKPETGARQRILLLGKKGQVGHALSQVLGQAGEVMSADHDTCDLADESALRRLVRQIHPDIIVNAAAYTAVDNAESQPLLAHAVNAAAPGILGDEAARLGAWVIHYSTDYVFDGEKKGAYSEGDKENPQNTYGQTKWEGEKNLAASGARYVILRTSWVLGAHGSNFVKTILRLAAERNRLDVVADQFGAPTTAELLASITTQIILQSSSGQSSGAKLAHTESTPAQLVTGACESEPFGLFHVAAAGVTTWCDYARFAIREARMAGIKLRMTEQHVHAIASCDYSGRAKRPKNSCLNTQKLCSTFGLVLPDWRSGVRDVIGKLS